VKYPHATDGLIGRLRSEGALSDGDVRAIRALEIDVRDVAANETIARDGEIRSECILVVEGYCVCSKTTQEGRTQILSIQIHGEIADLPGLLIPRLDFDLITLTNCKLGFISHDSLRDLIRSRPNIAESFWRDALFETAMLREWVVNVGQRQAPARLAHMVLELQHRLRAAGHLNAGRLNDGWIALPMTQEQLSQALGITAVHVNRVIKRLREENVLDYRRGRLRIINQRALQELAAFDPGYLHPVVARS
jgi:CRP-like cAMP-binding protein